MAEHKLSAPFKAVVNPMNAVLYLFRASSIHDATPPFERYRGRARSVCGVGCPVCGSTDLNHTHTSTAFNQPSQQSLDQVSSLCTSSLSVICLSTCAKAT